MREVVGSRSVKKNEKDLNGKDPIALLSVYWNQDYSCFAAGTSCGFRIYNSDPLKETIRRDVGNGGFKIVEMLFRCNVFALVGNGADSQYPTNKVLVWDDYKSRCIAEFSYRSEVRAVKLKRDRLVVVLEHKVFIYSLMDFKLLLQIETVANPKGLCCLSHHANTSPVLACPGLQRGQVHVEHFGLNITKLINAHHSHIACFTITMDGLLLATASTKGTLIRIFNTLDGTLLQEVRRGVEKAEIFSLTLSPNAHWLAVGSDKGTIHVFSLRVNTNVTQGPTLCHKNSSTSIDSIVPPNAGSNSSSSLSFMRGVLSKYFSSERSFAQFHLPEVLRFIAAFGSQNTIIIVGMDGSFYKCSFDPVGGGQMLQQECIPFF